MLSMVKVAVCILSTACAVLGSLCPVQGGLLCIGADGHWGLKTSHEESCEQACPGSGRKAIALELAEHPAPLGGCIDLPLGSPSDPQVVSGRQRVTGSGAPCAVTAQSANGLAGLLPPVASARCGTDLGRWSAPPPSLDSVRTSVLLI
jgi:hypothetical protein